MIDQYNPKQVLEVMRKISLMSLAVSDENNQPQSHMMLFAVDDDFTMYFATSSGSNKHKSISANNKIGMSVWSDKEMLIQITATAEEIFDDEAIKAVNKLADKATDIPNFWPPVLQIIKEGYAVFKTKPKTIRALDLTNNTISVPTTMFTNIGAQL